MKNEQSASVIGQRPNFTIADYSASADCENCSFGHCLVCVQILEKRTRTIAQNLAFLLKNVRNCDRTSHTS